MNAKEVHSRASPILRPHLLVPDHHRHHPQRRRVERSPEIKARLHPRRPFDRRLGQREINLMQRNRQAAIGIHGESHGEFRRRAALCLAQQQRILKPHRDLPGAARNAGINTLHLPVSADRAHRLHPIRKADPRASHLRQRRTSARDGTLRLVKGRKGRTAWRRKGDRKGERLWPLLSNTFNVLIEYEPFQDDADLVPGMMLLVRGAGNIAHQFFGSHPRGWDGGFLAHLHSS